MKKLQLFESSIRSIWHFIAGFAAEVQHELFAIPHSSAQNKFLCKSHELPQAAAEPSAGTPDAMHDKVAAVEAIKIEEERW